MVQQTRLFCNLLPKSLLTNLQRVGIIYSLHSWEKRTSFQSLPWNLVYSLYHLLRLFMLCLVKKVYWKLFLQKSLSARNILWIIYRKTFLTILKRICIVFSDWNWSFRHSWHKILYSRIINLAGLLDLLDH